MGPLLWFTNTARKASPLGSGPDLGLRTRALAAWRGRAVPLALRLRLGFVRRLARVAVADVVPDPKVRRPFLALQNRTGAVDTVLVAAAVGQLVVEKNGLPRLRLDAKLRVALAHELLLPRVLPKVAGVRALPQAADLRAHFLGAPIPRRLREHRLAALLHVAQVEQHRCEAVAAALPRLPVEVGVRGGLDEVVVGIIGRRHVVP
mmetsp:Transcript_16890/g.51916  ORF Transcript_16890/g.51916 Transcript_16890/m.51916 type:complete len:205 (-) Transcript_16890:263-877(-)